MPNSLIIPKNQLTLVTTEQAESFFCIRCEKDKKAKKRAMWEKPDGSIARICNGCYGNVLARQDEL